MNLIPFFIFFSFCGAIAVIIYLLYLVHRLELEVEQRVREGIICAAQQARMIVLNFEYDVEYHTYKLKGRKPVNADEEGNITWTDTEVYVSKQLEQEIGDLRNTVGLFVFPTGKTTIFFHN